LPRSDSKLPFKKRGKSHLKEGQEPPKLLPQLESQEKGEEDLKQQLENLTKELEETRACMILAQHQSDTLQQHFKMLEKQLIPYGFTCEMGPEGVLTLVENECSSSSSSKKRKMT
jgi:hypothetical protein